MAKVTAPLFGLGARGALGKVLVYFPWKGINCVREYVKPSNPQSALQNTQRGLMGDAVTQFHSSDFNAADMTAWAAFAATLAKTMSGFNAMCKTFIDEAILGNTWEPIDTVVVSAIGVAGFTVNVHKVSGGNTPDLKYGTRPTYLGTTLAMDDQTGDDWEEVIGGLASGVDYYFTIECGASGTDYGRVGIYKVRTS